MVDFFEVYSEYISKKKKLIRKRATLKDIFAKVSLLLCKEMKGLCFVSYSEVFRFFFLSLCSHVFSHSLCMNEDFAWLNVCGSMCVSVYVRSNVVSLQCNKTKSEGCMFMCLSEYRTSSNSTQTQERKIPSYTQSTKVVR